MMMSMDREKGSTFFTEAGAGWLFWQRRWYRQLGAATSPLRIETAGAGF